MVLRRQASTVAMCALFVKRAARSPHPGADSGVEVLKKSAVRDGELLAQLGRLSLALRIVGEPINKPSAMYT